MTRASFTRRPSLPRKRHTILFMAAAQSGADRLALDREARSIQKELEQSGHRDCFELETRWAVEPLDLLRELRKLKPTVVHLCGNSGQEGLLFQASDGHPQVVSATALGRAFGAAGGPVKLAVLSACYTEAQAEVLLAYVDCVVWMDSSIHHSAARSFAIGFYGGLGELEPIAAAHEQGRAAIDLEGLRDDARPQLKVRDGVDAGKLVLLDDRQLPP
ncbi:MAG TPA: CHAT domain-containing protein [Kofleriaceae bacterium]|nr:CHAT domain-containing protein [Kofleriaceae bacterium]